MLGIIRGIEDDLIRFEIEDAVGFEDDDDQPEGEEPRPRYM